MLNVFSFFLGTGTNTTPTLVNAAAEGILYDDRDWSKPDR
jgi:hypothetical protein